MDKTIKQLKDEINSQIVRFNKISKSLESYNEISDINKELIKINNEEIELRKTFIKFIDKFESGYFDDFPLK